MSTNEIKTKSRKAMKVQLAATLLAKGIGFLFSLLLVRILAPEDFGNLTFALLFTNFLTIFNNFGFQTFIIRNNSRNEKYLHTTFFLDVLFSLCISGILCGVALLLVPGSRIVVREMLLLYAVNIMVVAFGRSHLSFQKQQLNFAATAKADILFIIMSNLFKVVFAYFGFKALSFPLGDLAGNLLNLVYIYSMSPFRPSFRMFSRRAFRVIFWFGRNTVFTSLGSYLANQADKIMVTSKFSTTQVGFYNFGYSQSGGLYNILIGSQTQVFLSLFGKFKSNRAELKNIILKISSSINYIVSPLFLFGIIEAPTLIEVLFTEKWLPAIVIFRIFCADYLLRTFFSAITGVQISLGFADKAARTKIINSVVFVLVASIALFFNKIEVYGLFYLLASLIACLHNTHVNGKLVNITIPEFLLRYMPNAVLLAATTGSYLALELLWPESFTMNQFLFLLLKTIVFFSLYMIFSRLFVRNLLIQVRGFVTEGLLKGAN